MSLTSCEARQAILDTRTSNPQFYAELMSVHPPISYDATEEDQDQDSCVEEDIPDIPVLELEQAVMHLTATSELNQLLKTYNNSEIPNEAEIVENDSLFWHCGRETRQKPTKWHAWGDCHHQWNQALEVQ